jgi:parallel beta-helix repeat protein
MMKKALVIGITLLMLMSSMLVMVNESTGSENPVQTSSSPELGINALVSHAPIRINSNADFDADHGVTGGNGTKDDPYIIENYDIDGSGYGYCIYIGNTTDYFVVRNCSLHDADGADGTGLTLYNVQNGIVENNTVYNNEWNGISISSSKNNTINSNEVSSSLYGISICCSSNNTLSNNNASKNIVDGLYISSSPNITVNGNSISENGRFGTFIKYSTDDTLLNNNLTRDGIFVWGDSLEHWNTHNIDTSNTVNGKPVYYWKNQTGGSIPAGAGEIILANCSDVTIEKQNVSYGDIGIEIGFSDHINISNNTVIKNQHGIYIYSSRENKILNNTVSDNDWIGIELDATTKNTLLENKLIHDSITIDGNLENWNTHTIDTSNTVNGKPVYYWKNRTSGTIPAGAGEVILVNCTHITVEEQNLSYAGAGVGIVYSNNITISNTKICDNDIIGIEVGSSENITIVNNNVSKNRYGILFEGSDWNTICNNTLFGGFDTDAFWLYNRGVVGLEMAHSNHNIIKNNTISYNFYGIYMYNSNMNNIFHNNFINSINQAYDGTGNNYWNASYPDGGNYWSDYNGTDEYSGPNQDQPGSDGIGDSHFSCLSLVSI